MSEAVAKLFDDNSQALVAQRDEAAVARATQEIQAALVIGQRFPRDEVKVKARILQACQRKELAEVAEYEYSRGGTRITGPTIDLLRAIANRWGNLRFGWTEVERRDGASSVRCFAWDVQTNGQAERTFQVVHRRDTRDGGYELKDERDIYEMLANQAARRVRACLEEVIDSDIVTAAVDACRDTLRKGEKVPLADRAVTMVTAFAEHGVTQTMIETRLGNKLDAVSENQLASLRRVYKSLKDGVGKREDYFKPETAKPEFAPPTPAQAQIKSEAAARQADALGAAGPDEFNSKPVAPAATAAAPAEPLPVIAPAPEAQSIVRAVRGLCKIAKIKEGALLEYLSKVGLGDGSNASLEDLQLTRPEVLQTVHDRWTDVADAILRAQKEQKGAK